MVEKIVLGRDREDMKKYGLKGTAFIGKHIVGKGDESHFTNPVHIDVARPHVILVCGKRGTGKSYSAGVFAEEIAMLPPDVKNNLSVLMIDTMGIYWSMKTPNEKDSELLLDWGLKPTAVNTKLLIPKTFENDYKESGIKVDGSFTLACGELTSMDWIISFGFSMIDKYGIVIERVIKSVRKRLGDSYGIGDITKEIIADARIEKEVKDALTNRFMAAEEWGIFEKEGTPIKDIFMRGGITIIDVSHYMRASQGWSVRSMLVGLLSRKIFQERLMARKREEFEIITGNKKETIPMIWIMIDECHQFIPSEGETAASEPLLTLIKEGREPGISLLMITQRPNKLHPDALAQSDIVLSHRLTSRADIEALRGIMQTYMIDDIQQYINSLPKSKGTAIVLDDNSERIYPITVRPRISWHAGGSPSAIKEKFLNI